MKESPKTITRTVKPTATSSSPFLTDTWYQRRRRSSAKVQGHQSNLVIVFATSKTGQFGHWRRTQLLSKGMTMRLHLIPAVMITLCVAACNNAKTPETVAKDVAKAEQKAATEVTKSENSAVKDLNSAAEKVDDKLVAFNNAAAKDAYNLAVAKADGDRKVALATCESVGGTEQKRCKERAEAEYQATKANAKAAAQAEKQ